MEGTVSGKAGVLGASAVGRKQKCSGNIGKDMAQLREFRWPLAFCSHKNPSLLFLSEVTSHSEANCL